MRIAFEILVSKIQWLTAAQARIAHQVLSDTFINQSLFEWLCVGKGRRLGHRPGSLSVKLQIHVLFKWSLGIVR